MVQICTTADQLNPIKSLLLDMMGVPMIVVVMLQTLVEVDIKPSFLFPRLRKKGLRNHWIHLKVQS